MFLRWTKYDQANNPFIGWLLYILSFMIRHTKHVTQSTAARWCTASPPGCSPPIKPVLQEVKQSLLHHICHLRGWDENRKRKRKGGRIISGVLGEEVKSENIASGVLQAKQKRLHIYWTCYRATNKLKWTFNIHSDAVHSGCCWAGSVNYTLDRAIWLKRAQFLSFSLSPQNERGPH